MPETNAALTVGLALGAGVVAQVIARHLLLPGIVLLLVAGVLLGPDVAGVVRPEDLGSALRILVGFAVAVILFDGGLNLDLRRLREEAKAIRRLVTFGAIITGVGGALAAWLLMDWNDWRAPVLFGTLVIVTGPTVVTPLVRRLRLREPVSTILEAEGVLIDPIGAIIAVVALEVLYAPETQASLLAGMGTAASVLGLGAGIGLVGGLIMGLLLKPRRLVPPGLENIFVLSLVVTLFQVSDAIVHESGLAAVVVAGMIVGNVQTRTRRQLLDFKEQLTVLMIGFLFVLLAADVRLREVAALGWPAVATVAALILVVRPIQVWACTEGSKLDLRDRALLALMAPRGIVAAAVASLFAQQLTERGEPIGDTLRALVFLVIAVTVGFYGIAGAPIAAWLGVKQATANGYAMLGANGLARAIARLLQRDDERVVLIDSNADMVELARKEGLDVIHGQGLQPAIIADAEPASRRACIALTSNEEVNLLFARAIRDETRVPVIHVALRHEPDSVPIENVHEIGATVLFGRGRRISLWAERFDHDSAHIELWSRDLPGPSVDEEPMHTDDGLLPIAVLRRGRLRLWDEEVQLGERETIAVAIENSLRERAEALLREHGFTPVDAQAETGVKAEA